MDPVILFFIFGVIAGLARADLRLPKAAYEVISIILLLAIGIKGGVVLSKQPVTQILPQILAIMLMGAAIAILAYHILKLTRRFKRADSASIAAHYGSVSVGTFAVVLSYLDNKGVFYEEHLAVLVVALEIPAIIVGVVLAESRRRGTFNWGKLSHEVFTGKGIALLVGGLAIGWISGTEGMTRIGPLFVDMFGSVLALFLLEMGMVAAERMSDMRRQAAVLVVFALLFPLLAAAIGSLTAVALGMSLGGTVIVATLAASASYIAVPAAMRISVPEANPSLSIAASVGVTFPFNILIGIPIYYYSLKAILG